MADKELTKQEEAKDETVVESEEKVVVEDAKEVETKDEVIEETEVENDSKENTEDEVFEEVELGSDDDKSFEESVEEKRAVLYKLNLKIKRISNILYVIAIVLCIAGMLFVSGENAWIGWLCLGGALAIILPFFFINRNWYGKRVREYVDFVSKCLREETFDDSSYFNVQENEESYQVADFDGNGAYTDICKVISRKIVSGKYDDLEFKLADVAIFKTPEDKKHMPMSLFVGKYVAVPNELDFEGNVLFNISRDEPIDSPNTIQNLSSLYNANNMAVYGTTENMEFRKVIGEDFFAYFKKMTADRQLLNLAISISKGRTLVFMSYNEEVINFPTDKPFNAEPFRTYVEDLKNVFEGLKLLGK